MNVAHDPSESPTETAPITGRAKRRMARKQEMIDAAMALILEDGSDKLTIARLAARLDAAVGALYRYFPGKDALMVGVQQQAIEQLRIYMAERTDVLMSQLPAGLPEKAHTLAAVGAVFQTYLDHAVAEPRVHLLVDQFISTPVTLLSDERARTVAGTLDPLFDFVKRRLNAACEAGALEPGDNSVRMHVAWAGLHGLDHFRKRDRVQVERLKVAHLERELLTALFVGWGATRDDCDAAFDALAD